MKITLILVGKTTDKPVEVGMDKYAKRIQRYLPFQIEVIPALKNAKKMSEAEIKQKEGGLILNKISAADHIVLLDEKGKEYTSVLFSSFIKKKMIHGMKSLVFIIGGAYGFSDAVYQRANSKLALSQMTFSHQLIRLIFLEQLYRSFTIINNEPYHHE
ncbi:MAG: 23S rRNA (pseudouridine(1915)-N(3))-methyltransferase RlmH [Bacteroidales bacterium]|nr:23S rRNA (pseudouridine(1915)-N(3))-methyltransferase RlmH [Bacteroidales bacterium]